MSKKIKDFSSNVNQIDFSILLFDTIFGLILFFNTDSFLEITDPVHWIFYFFSTVVVIHWWLIFKSVDDTYGEEVNNSAADMVFGIIYLILIYYNVLMARSDDYTRAVYFLIALFAIDLIWAVIWRHVGNWRSKDKEKTSFMEKDLNYTIAANIIVIALFIPITVFANSMNIGWFVGLYIAVYSVYIFLTFKFKILDINVFKNINQQFHRKKVYRLM